MSPPAEALPGNVGEVIGAVQNWACRESDIVAVALVGSWARGAGRGDSDVDLVVLAKVPGRLLSDNSWFGVFGPGAVLMRSRDFGAISERRLLRRPDGLEVEVGIGGPGWASTEPADVGSLRVARDGMRILHDPHGLLHALAVVAHRA